jgi:imidazole glycerol-phosphate synthase subunit HisH
MITIINYGMGNLGSVQNMFKRIGYQTEITSDIDVIAKAKKILLPGVGAFGNAMTLIDEKGFRAVLNQKALLEKVPTLGICLGMQLLTRSSEESPNAKGLGWIAADTKRFVFPANSNFKVPHMGWNEVEFPKMSRFTEGYSEKPRYYFVHSYHVVLDNPSNAIMTTHHGYDFVAGLQHENIYGAQFHPEKSHKFGMKLFENFAKL